MSVPTITETVLRVITAVAAGAIDKSSAFNISGKFGCIVFIDHAPDTTGTPGAGPEFRIETNSSLTNEGSWVPFDSKFAGVTAAASGTTNANAAAGATVLSETDATAGIVNNSHVFLKNGTIANSEWVRVFKVTSNTSFEIVDGLTNAQASGTKWTTQANRFQVPIINTGYARIRVVFNNARTSAIDAVWACRVGSLDSIS